MKYIIYFLFLFQYSIAQEFIENQKLIKTLLEDDSYGDGKLRIISNINKKFINRKLYSLKRHNTFENQKLKYKIIISNSEKRKIIRGLKKSFTLTQLQNDFKEYEFITSEESSIFLKQNSTYQHSNRIMLFSKPVYIRNNEYAIIYFLHMCCIDGGNDSIWIYKIVDGNWQKWVPISQSSF